MFLTKKVGDFNKKESESLDFTGLKIPRDYIHIKEVCIMLWDIIEKEKYYIYINRDIDLKIKIFETNEEDQIYINYKGFNVTIPMLVWELGEDLNLASIENVRIEGEDCFDKHFVIKKEDKDNFLNEIYFFLVDNNMDSVLQERYRVNWG